MERETGTRNFRKNVETKRRGRRRRGRKQQCRIWCDWICARGAQYEPASCRYSERAAEAGGIRQTRLLCLLQTCVRAALWWRRCLGRLDPETTYLTRANYTRIRCRTRPVGLRQTHPDPAGANEGEEDGSVYPSVGERSEGFGMFLVGLGEETQFFRRVLPDRHALVQNVGPTSVP
jgi:hypothetical protein